MFIKSFTFNPFSTNCYVVESDQKCAIIDPGCQTAEEVSQLMEFIEEKNLIVEKLLLTHAHIDHIFGCRAISRAYNLPFLLHDADLPLFQNGHRQAELFGFPLDLRGVEVVSIHEGDQIGISDVVLNVLCTPGHSPGSVSFADYRNKNVFSGDVLFRGSIGRTDLWEGSMPVLMDSIRQVLYPLGDDCTVYSGHGPVTTIGYESKSNPFLADI